jgi:hypothetical protein
MKTDRVNAGIKTEEAGIELNLAIINCRAAQRGGRFLMAFDFSYFFIESLPGVGGASTVLGSNHEATTIAGGYGC